MTGASDHAGTEAPEFEDIQRRIALAVVPLVPITGQGEEARRTGIGSGVLVRIAKNYYLLTAGHCVHEFKHDKLAVAIARGEHLFMPEILSRDYVFDETTGKDWGYFRLSEYHARQAEALSRAFLSLASVTPPGTDEMTESSRFVVGGFPRDWIQAIPPRRSKTADKLELLYFEVPTVSRPAASEDGARGAPENIDYNVPVRSWVVRGPGERSEEPTPNLNGLSGGGVWTLPAPGSVWRNRDMRLIGIHIGSAYSGGVEDPRVGRAVSIAHHLRLVAANEPSAADEIENHFPGLLDS